MEVLQLGGLDAELYPLIGPLVMSPKVLKANNNYPFKTAEHYQWYIAINEHKEVMGFLPVEKKNSGLIINNYYIEEDSEELLTLLFSSIETEKPITAIVLIRHLELFTKLGFKTEHQWTKYIRMIHNTTQNEEQKS